MKNSKYGNVGIPLSNSQKRKRKSGLLGKLGTIAVVGITLGTTYLGGEMVSNIFGDNSTKNFNLEYQGYFPYEGKNILVFDEISYSKRNIRGPEKRFESPKNIDPDTLKINKQYNLEVDNYKSGSGLQGEITSIKEE